MIFLKIAISAILALITIRYIKWLVSVKSDIYKDAIIGFYFSSNQQKAEFLVYGNKRGFQYFIDECMKFKNELWCIVT